MFDKGIKTKILLEKGHHDAEEVKEDEIRGFSLNFLVWP
jgi:hypothetical protein